MKLGFLSDGTAAFTAPRSTKLSAMLSEALATPRLWARRRHERASLQQLDDHLLRDIGLDRSRVDEMAARPFWRE